jgi:hypothetical protein
MAFGDWLGRTLGAPLGAVTGVVAGLRRARMFHPEGFVFQARMTPWKALSSIHPDAAANPEAFLLHRALKKVAERVEGAGLVRLSSAWWRNGKEWVDALGLAVRLQREPSVDSVAHEGDQDLLFATIRFPWTTLLAPFSTQVHDFLANDYYAVSPFEVPELGRVQWRLVSAGPELLEGSRPERLRAAVCEGRARFRLDLKTLRPRSGWLPVASLKLLDEVKLDQAELRFSPFRTGRHIEPRGFVHALRLWTYRTSQAARPAHET